MTVKELIEELQQLPSDVKVVDGAIDLIEEANYMTIDDEEMVMLM